MIDYEPGKEYCVPTIGNVAVILPSHVDQGSGKPTGRHYHVDRRFGPGLFNIEDVDEEFAAEQGLINNVYSEIVLDDRVPVWKTLKAVANWVPSGELFTSTCWLYKNLGDKVSKDGRCVHHPTRLQPKDGCLVCPAHGMKFNNDGSPRYRGPFWLCIDESRAPLDDAVTLTGLSGMLLDKVLRLEDNDGVVIASDAATNMGMHNIQIHPNDNLNITLHSWSHNPCLRLKKSTS